MEKQARNWGIDVLRSFSMVGVVLLHVLGHGGILNEQLSTTSYCIVWLLELFAYPAVNCFVLISGYVGYRDDNIPPPKNQKAIVFNGYRLLLQYFHILNLHIARHRAFGIHRIGKKLVPDNL